ncbi:MAG: serine/threonine protein kinase [Pedosphaera sp.]|nr:serine/threonine protein kinase [Pedosphaera sp.]
MNQINFQTNLERRLASPLIAALALLVSVSALAGNWPAWRGPDGSGVTKETKLPIRWSATENVRWKLPLPGPGNSSPIVWENRVFIAQAVEAEGRHTVMCVDRTTGKQMWQSGPVHKEKEQSHDMNPQCSASPVTDGERVIAWFGSAGVYCYDFAGKEIWHRDLGKQSHEWGYGASPVLNGNLCILNFGPGERAFLIALDKTTGQTVWQVDVPQIAPKERTDGFAGKEKGAIGSWSTPIIVRANGRDELVMSYPDRVRGFDPSTGKELWHCDGLNPLVYTSPLYGEGLVVAMGGFYGSHLAVKPGGKGDVTASNRVWHQVKGKSGIGTGVINDGYIYNMYGSIVACSELKTGKIVWEERVQGSGANSDSWSSMVLSGDKIYFLNQSGDTVVLRASPKFEKIAINSLGGETANSSIAVSNGDIIIRTHKHLWCISSSKSDSAQKKSQRPTGSNS